MPAVETSNAAPSTLAIVIGQVRDALRAMGNAIPVSLGKAYKSDDGPGNAPRVLVIADRDGGKIGPPIEMGYAASMIHACEVYVRAVETGDDLTRFDGAYRLADLLVDLFGTACTGRIEWGAGGDDSPLDVDAYGADYGFRFTYRRDIPHNPKRWALAPAPADTSPPYSPTAPQAVPGTEPTTFVGTVTPQE